MAATSADQSNLASPSDPRQTTRALILATLSFFVTFAAWGLIGGLASVFAPLYQLTASQTALLVAVPVLLGALARLPMGMLTDRYGGRAMFTGLLLVSAVAAWAVTWTTSYTSLLVAAFFVGLAGAAFSIGVAFVSRWSPPGRQGTALGIYGLGTQGSRRGVRQAGGGCGSFGILFFRRCGRWFPFDPPCVCAWNPPVGRPWGRTVRVSTSPIAAAGAFIF